MSTITVGSFAYSGTFTSRAQSFTPNVSGPDGTGSVGDLTSVNLDAVSYGYATSSTANRAGTCYLYDYVPTLADLNNGGTGSLATSTGTSDESSGEVFGANTYSRTWEFDQVAIDPTKKYYLFLSANNSLRYKTGNPYSGGDLYNGTLIAQTSDLQFKIVMDDGS